MSKLARLMDLVEYVVIRNIKKIEIEYFNEMAYKIKFNIGDSEVQRLSEFQSFLATIDWPQVEEVEIELYNGQASEIEFLDGQVGSRGTIGITDEVNEIGELGTTGPIGDAGAMSEIGSTGVTG